MPTPNAPTNMSFLFTGRKFLEATRSPATALVRTAALFPAVILSDSTAPSQPGTPVGTAVSQTQISWTWTVSTDTGGSGLQGYRVYLDGATSPTTTVATNSYDSTGHTASTAHTLRVEAYDGQGNTTSSGTGSQTTQASSGGSGLTHGQSFTVTGSGFGTKSGSTPIAFDQGTGAVNTFGSPWSGGWPSTAGASNIQLQNTGFRSMAGPHARALKYYAGCHVALNTSTGGNNVMLWKNYVRPAFPYYTYWCWWYRMDPSWLFNAGYGSNPLDNDNNMKLADFSNGAEPYDLSNNWYYQFNNGITNQSVDGYFGSSCNDDGPGVLTRPDLNGNNPTFSCGQDVSAYSPFTAWRKFEIETKHNSSTDGYVKGWMDNHQIYNYAGRTDNFPGTTRTEAIGGYARNRSANQFRYFSDIYYERQTTGAARFLLTNNATYTSATIAEPQGYESWTSTAVGLICNRGALPAGTAHLHFRCPVNGNQYLGTRTLA